MTPTSAPTSRPAVRPKAPRDDREIAGLARALGHPARVAILRFLIERGDCICGQIVDVMPLAQATVSQHLKVLKDAGLVRGEVDGPRVCYCANPESLQQLGERLIALAQSGKGCTT
jgi:ArsR family transcriptional regulator